MGQTSVGRQQQRRRRWSRQVEMEERYEAEDLDKMMQKMFLELSDMVGPCRIAGKGAWSCDLLQDAHRQEDRKEFL